MKTFIIAEAGANHNRNLQQAFRLIDIAKDSNCNAVKFQTYSSETLYAKNTPDFAGYKNINQLIKDIELPREWQKDLKQYCDNIGIEFMSTPFDEKAVDELVSLGVKRLKIAGFESSDFRFVEMVASSKLPLIISIGIGFPIDNIGKILDITSRYGNELSLLHCNNAYPTPLCDVDLGLIKELKSFNGVSKSGLSDHTISEVVPSFAVIAGAEIIEKHFTISRLMKGPDHSFALEPIELKNMVDLIKQAELCIIKNNAEYSQSEQNFISARRSVVSTREIKKGTIITKKDITTKRPFLEGCIPAMNYNNVIGSVVQCDIPQDSPIKSKDIS